ncbi:MAG: DNA polymerase III subunit delta' [Parvibaculales bacterium]
MTESDFDTQALTDVDGAQSPRLCRELHGHDRATTLFKQALTDNKLHHAWLLTGPKGIGKASFAYQAAKYLLSLKPGQTPVMSGDAFAEQVDSKTEQLIENGGHPDLFIMNRPYDVKKKDFKKDIPVDSARALRKFMTMTSGFGGWRVCIIDCAEDMTPQAANAILKTLEEPSGKTVFFLISHRPGKLLDTIRSRCQKMPMENLEKPQMQALLKTLRPELDEQVVQAVAHLAEGSIGQALQIADLNGLEIYRDMVDVLASLPALDGVKLHGFAGRMADRRNESAFRLFSLFLSGWLHGLTRTGATGGQGIPLFEGEVDVMQRFLSAAPLEQWIDVWEKVASLLRQSDTLNLDRKQTVIECFSAIRKAAH